MKTVQKALALAVVAAVGGILFQYYRSRTFDGRLGTSERRIDDVSRDTKAQGESLKAHQGEIESHGKDIADLERRLAVVEDRVKGLDKASEADRAEISKLHREIDALKAREAEAERRRRDLEDLGQDLKKRLERDAEVERRLHLIEKKLGIERPQP